MVDTVYTHFGTYLTRFADDMVLWLYPVSVLVSVIIRRVMPREAVMLFTYEKRPYN